MTTIHRPEISLNETHFEMQGHTRIFQKNYLPPNHRKEFDRLMGKSVEKYGRKVKEITVFKKALDAANVELSSLIRSSRNHKSTYNSRTRRNLASVSNGTTSPVN